MKEKNIILLRDLLDQTEAFLLHKDYSPRSQRENETKEATPPKTNLQDFPTPFLHLAMRKDEQEMLLAWGRPRVVFVVGASVNETLLTPQDEYFVEQWLVAIGLSGKNAWVTPLVTATQGFLADAFVHEKADFDTWITWISPTVVVSLGQEVGSILTGDRRALLALREQSWQYAGFPFFPFFHPADVLLNVSHKRPIWEDLKKIQRIL